MIGEWIADAQGPRIDRMLRTVYDTVGWSPVVCPRADGRMEDGLVVPGRRLPHRWIDESVAAFDLVGNNVVLIAEPSTCAEAEWLAAAALEDGHHVDVRQVPAGTYDQPLLLVRPDRFVAWCAGSSIPAVAAVAASFGHGQSGQDAQLPFAVVSSEVLH